MVRVSRVLGANSSRSFVFADYNGESLTQGKVFATSQSPFWTYRSLDGNRGLHRQCILLLQRRKLMSTFESAEIGNSQPETAV